MASTTDFPATVDDYAALARRRLPRFLADYIDGGAGAEITLAANTGDWAALRLRQRVLVDVDGVDTSTALLGRSCALPVALAPIGLAGMMARRGEVQAVHAADALGIPFTLSTVGICSIEEVAAAAQQPFWFQLYMMRDRGVVRALMQRAWAAGCRQLLFTVDLPLPGARHRDVRNGLAAASTAAKRLKARQMLARPAWLWDVAIHGKPHGFGSLTAEVPDAKDFNAFKAWVDRQFDPGVTWQDIEWLRNEWQGTLALKGILDAEDADAALRVGADAIVVSNHGGRQLDAAASTAAKLPEIVATVAGRAPVLVDGGVRNGADVFKALALGAQGVLIGRPWIWALAARGEQGVRDLLAAWQRELLLTMTMAGVTRIADIGPSNLENM